MAPSQKPFYIALGVVVAGGIVFLASRIVGRHAVSIPANVVVTTADTSGFRGYVMGSPTAPVEITEYADFECPHCATFDQVSFPDIKTRVIDNGKARWRYRDFPLDGVHKQTRVAAHAAACADEQNHFWDYKTGLFARQNDWAFRDNAMSILREIASSAGLDAAKWQTCMESARYAGRIQASLDEGNKLGVNSTPSFLIGGRIYTQIESDSIVKLVDSLVKAAPAPAAAAPGPVVAAPAGGQ